MASKKISFFESYYEAIADLPAEEYKTAVNALLAYAFHGIEPQGLTGMAKMFFCMAKPIVDNGKKSADNGSDGGRPSKDPTDNQQDTEEKPTGFQKNNQQVSENKPAGSDAPRNRNMDKDIGNGERNMEKDSKSIPSPAALTREFEEVWKLYPQPRRQGKKEAIAAYIRARQNGSAKETIAGGVKAYCAYLARNRTEPQFIKQGGSFFYQQMWADDWSGGTSNPYLNNNPPDDLDGIL